MTYHCNIGTEKFLSHCKAIWKCCIFQVAGEMLKRIPFLKSGEAVTRKNGSPTSVQCVHVALNSLMISPSMRRENSDNERQMIEPGYFSHLFVQKTGKPEIDLAPIEAWGTHDR